MYKLFPLQKIKSNLKTSYGKIYKLSHTVSQVLMFVNKLKFVKLIIINSIMVHKRQFLILLNNQNQSLFGTISGFKGDNFLLDVIANQKVMLY